MPIYICQTKKCWWDKNKKNWTKKKKHDISDLKNSLTDPEIIALQEIKNWKVTTQSKKNEK